jgi:hypothetical protein
MHHYKAPLSQYVRPLAELSKMELRERARMDTQLFLERGGKIQIIPSKKTRGNK